MYICMYVYMYVCVCIYIYIYIEREREIDRYIHTHIHITLGPLGVPWACPWGERHWRLPAHPGTSNYKNHRYF